MNPWLILGWATALCLTALVVACTVAAIIGMFKPHAAPKGDRTTQVMGGDES